MNASFGNKKLIGNEIKSYGKGFLDGLKAFIAINSESLSLAKSLAAKYAEKVLMEKFENIDQTDEEVAIYDEDATVEKVANILIAAGFPEDYVQDSMYLNIVVDVCGTYDECRDGLGNFLGETSPWRKLDSKTASLKMVYKEVEKQYGEFVGDEPTIIFNAIDLFAS